MLLAESRADFCWRCRETRRLQEVLGLSQRPYASPALELGSRVGQIRRDSTKASFTNISFSAIFSPYAALSRAPNCTEIVHTDGPGSLVRDTDTHLYVSGGSKRLAKGRIPTLE